MVQNARWRAPTGLDRTRRETEKLVLSTKAELIEWGIILLGIVCLWPKYILQWPHPFWDYFAYAMLVLLGVVLGRRLKRITDAAKGHAAGKRPHL